MNVNFTIYGNHEDPEGNPIPYVRSTRGALWRKDGKRYAAWKGYVRKSLIVADIKDQLIVQIKENMWKLGKPLFIGKSKARMDMRIYWKDNAHGDPDNVWKGIADALFVNDRNLDGSFESSVAEYGKGRVDVSISIA